MREEIEEVMPSFKDFLPGRGAKHPQALKVPFLISSAKGKNDP
jgi:hypothetical protein